MASDVNVHTFLPEKSDTCVYKRERTKKREGLNFPNFSRSKMAAQNYIRLFELIFDRVFDPVESLQLLFDLEIPPADPGTILTAHIDRGVKVVARFVGGHLSLLLLLRVSLVLKADFIAIRTKAAFLS